MPASSLVDRRRDDHNPVGRCAGGSREDEGVTERNRIGVVGGGIIGLAVARELARTRPGAEVTVLEAEDRLATHQTGRNSGVVHAGLYYRPGSLKATLCREGMAMLRAYCAEHGLRYAEVGKVVVAVGDAERPGLEQIAERALANGVPDIRRLNAAALREVEPHAAGVAAVHSPHTAVTDFPVVAARLAADVEMLGGRVLLGHRVRGVRRHGDRVLVLAGVRVHGFDLLVGCAGLGGDALAKAAGCPGEVRIVPFRGEYYRLSAASRSLVRGLIYPVPDPRYPFLGVHLTRRIDGEVLAGPNAVLALAYQGYRWRDVRPADLGAVLAWPGTRRMAARYWRTGLSEMAGSLSKHRFLALTRAYLPALEPADLETAASGVRAQAVLRDGTLLDDFAIDVCDRVVLVRNAPSPGATSSLAIARHVVSRLPS